MSNIYTTTLRLNLDKETDRTALAYLQAAGVAAYKSYSRAVVAAVNDHFARMEHQTDDPYLETRQKEDAFLRRIEEAVERGLRAAMITGRGELSTMPRDAAPLAPAPDAEEEASEDLDASLEFLSTL